MASPADDTNNIQVSLSKRAPIGPIPKRTLGIELGIPALGSLTYENILEQKNPCIRSQVSHSSFTRKKTAEHLNQDIEATTAGGIMKFPYPPAFQKLLKKQPQTRVVETVETTETLNIDGMGNNMLPRQDPLMLEPYTEIIQVKDGIGISFSFATWTFDLKRNWVFETKIPIQPVYVVLGIFQRGDNNPQERIAFVNKPERLFRELRCAVFRLRGLSSTLLSLRTVKSLRLYRCNIEEGTHERINLDDSGIADLQLLLRMYKSWYVPEHVVVAWANWIHQTLNNSSLDVLDGTYAIEFVLDWSVTRISIVILFPVLLSLAIGLWLNSAAWADLTTIQTAWGTASYVVTAGSLLAALLAIIGSIGNK
ncbi:hypothetical protein GGI43DRAFT_366128 [Trichoderma evansii]